MSGLGGQQASRAGVLHQDVSLIQQSWFKWLNYLCKITWKSGTVIGLSNWSGGASYKETWRLCSNFREIVLLSLPGNIFARILERRAMTSCLHWEGLQPSVKWLGWKSAPPTLKPWFSAKKGWSAHSRLGISCCHERMSSSISGSSSWVRVAEMSFHLKMSRLTLQDRRRSSVILGGLSFLHQKKQAEVS